MRTFVIGDIHGGHKALLQCFERAGFDRENDTLISLGDICDGWPDVKECVEELLKIKNLIFVLGNHDAWFRDWYKTGFIEHLWRIQGGQATLDSYKDGVPENHRLFFDSAVLYHEDDKGRVFVHGGLEPQLSDMSRQNPEVLLWDRSLVRFAKAKHEKRPDFAYGRWNEIFVGHTSTGFVFRHDGPTIPHKVCNVWLLDTGCGWEGKLTMMNVDTHEYFQSDFVYELYPGLPGRRKGGD